MSRAVVGSDSKIALVLVQALFYGDKIAAKDWSISTQTVRNYRKRLNTDSELYVTYNQFVDEFSKDWLSDAPIAIRRAIRWITDNLPKLESNAENLEAVSQSLRLLVEIQLTKETFDVRLAEYHRQELESAEQMAAENTSPKTIEAEI